MTKTSALAHLLRNAISTTFAPRSNRLSVQPRYDQPSPD